MTVINGIPETEGLDNVPEYFDAIDGNVVIFVVQYYSFLDKNLLVGVAHVDQTKNMVWDRSFFQGGEGTLLRISPLSRYGKDADTSTQVILYAAKVM